MALLGSCRRRIEDTRELTLGYFIFLERRVILECCVAKTCIDSKMGMFISGRVAPRFGTPFCGSWGLLPPRYPVTMDVN